MKNHLLVVCAFCALLFGACTDKKNQVKEEIDFSSALQPIPRQAILQEDDYYVWGASPVKGDDGKYHLYYSRWKKEYGFEAWVTRSEIAHAVSDHLFGPYHFADVALPERGGDFWDGHTTHNPTIQKWDGKYYLYYMGNRGDRVDQKQGLNWSHRNNQRIGVAVSDSPAGPWKRFDKPLLDASADSTASDALLVSNPSITKRPDGKFLMVYKAVGKKKRLPFGGPVVHLTAVADAPTGPFVKNPKLAFTNPGVNFAAEDPYVWCQDGRYYAIVKDMAGYFTKVGRSLALFVSDNGVDWHQAKHSLASKLILNWQDNPCDTVVRLERPQLYIEEGLPKALFVAVTPKEQGKLTFNVHIPLKFE